MAKPGK